MKIIYVAGAYRADTENGVFENIMRARKKARELWLEGWVVICPHMNTAFMDGGDPQRYLDGSLELLERCDAIYMLKDYGLSHGAMCELVQAEKQGLEIYFEEG